MNKFFIPFTLLLIFINNNTYSQTAALDVTFGVGGIVKTDVFNDEDYSLCMLVQSDGKILMGGNAVQGFHSDFTLIRCLSNGSLDNSFGINGIVTTAISPFGSDITSIAVVGDSAIIAVGAAENSSNHDIAVARYFMDGSIDSSFGSSGYVITPIGTDNDYGTSVAIQSDGKIVVSGYGYFSGIWRIIVVRYNIGGWLDPTFSGDGKETTLIAGEDAFSYTNAIQTDGKIVVGGTSGYLGTPGALTLVRYNGNGSLDTSFSSDGITATTIGSGASTAYGIVIQDSTKILATGEAHGGSTTSLALVRYHINGNPDSTFNGTGVVETTFGPDDNVGRKLLIEPDSSIIVGGFSYNGSNSNFAVAMYTPSGGLDPNFSADGKATYDMGSEYDFATSIAVQTDGKILVGGYSRSSGDADFTVMRIHNYYAGIDDEENSVLQVYPNPTGGTILITSDEYFENANLKVVNSTGQMVITKKHLTGNQFTLDLSPQSAGMYFVYVITGNGQFITRVIKE